MSEFKGTKGKWIAILGKPDVFAKIKIGKGTLDLRSLDFDSKSYKEENANALLISKSPEMLDFITRISGEMLRNDFVLDEKWYEQAQQLIKQSTEL